MEHVPNLSWRDAHGRIQRNDPAPALEDLNALPAPDHSTVAMDRFFTPRPIHTLMLSRGCYWGRCTFCSIGWRENYRMASAAKIRADVLELVHRQGARYAQIQDSSIPPRAARILAEIVAEESVALEWCGGMKFDRHFLDAEYCRILYRGGCRSLQVGVESASQETLDAMDKGFQIDEVPTMLRNLRDAGISVELLWFIGFPRESRRDALKTAQFLHSHRDLFGLCAFVGDYQLHPDTEVFHRPQDFGVTIAEESNDRFRFRVDRGMQSDEVGVLKDLLACTNNRTLVCNGSHLLHVAESGLDLRALERPIVVPPEVVEFCAV